MSDNTVLVVGSIGLDTIETPTEKQENIIGELNLVQAGNGEIKKEIMKVIFYWVQILIY